MSETTPLRTETRCLYDAAREIREEDIPEIQAEKERVRAEAKDAARENLPEGVDRDPTPRDAPDRYHNQFNQLHDIIGELEGTAQTYEHYAEQWSDDENSCEFVLMELNGDEYAQTIDQVSAEAKKQAREDGDLPEGFGRVKALEFGVEEKPEHCPPYPGEWPAPIINELFEALNEITAPSGVDLGNESLSEAWDSDDTTTTPALDSMDTPATGTTPDVS